MLVCPHCRAALDPAFCCPECARCYPVEHGIADFAEGAYYDHFDATTALTPAHREGLQLELEGTRRRILDYYLPLLPRAARVLDCGCGNGLSVDLLRERGLDAWGNDLSQLRKWQWREREHRDRLVVASALSLPFAGDSFDVVISSGVIEHIGVEETAIPRYAVTPLPNRDALRAAFLRELLRVAPTVDRERAVRTVDVHALVSGARVEALSPYKRLQFRQASQHWYGRLLARPADWYFRFMPRAIARSALNPFLVVRVTR